MTREEIEAGRSEKGGWTKETLANWGVPWPPPKGWKDKLIAGEYIEPPRGSEPSAIRPEKSAHDILREVVVAVINAGHASDLYEFPDVLEYFGAQVPR